MLGRRKCRQRVQRHGAHGAVAHDKRSKAVRHAEQHSVKEPNPHTIFPRSRHARGSLAKRFWAKVDKGDSPTACWEWKGNRSWSGYGLVWIAMGAIPQKAHRVAWKLCNGDINEEQCVLHHCDNRLCVNPDHLFLGTRADNARDRNDKGRSRTRPLRGEANHLAKFTAADVLAIRQKYAAGGMSAPELAREFGCGTSHIYRIIKRQAWTHI